MSDINVTSATSTYSAYTTAPKAEGDAKEVNTEKTAGVAEVGAVYEKSDEKKSGLYSINKMSADDRAKLVTQLKADQENRMSQLTKLVTDMMKGQATTFAKASVGDDDSIWKFLAEGNFTVDPATKALAQADIAEDGYWGVKQTSQRLFDFASALAGDDVDKMKEMEEAMEKGFKKAADMWGRELPDISKQTMDAAHQLFEDYYASKA